MAGRDRPFADLADLQTRAGITAPHIRRLAEADAMRSMFLDRRQALWDARALRDAPDLPLFRGSSDEGADFTVPLPVMPVCEQVVADYQTLRLSLKAHPMSFLRKSLAAQGYAPAASLQQSRNRQGIRMAGLVLIRQRPGTAKGVCFITLEDETGVANLVVWPKVMEQFRKAVMQSRLLVVHGHIQRDVDIIHVIADRLEDRTDALLRLTEGAQTGAARNPLKPPAPGHPRNLRILPKSRDFH
jgi:error-prone DNA polymerase